MVVVEVLPPAEEPEFDFPAWLRLRLFFLVCLLLLAIRTIRQLRLEQVGLRQQAHYWHSQFQRAKQRLEQSQQQVQQLQAEIRELKRRLYGRKSETTTAATSGTNRPSDKPPRPRGQQAGARGPTRRNYEHLPTKHETCQVSPEQQRCAACGASWRKLPGSDTGQILEVEVRAHRRVYHRERYERT